MSELLSAAQMRAIETVAIEGGEVSGLELMERAGRGVVEAVFEAWPELAVTSHRAVVLCGPGNNGGDGFVVARLLKDWGWEVEVFLYGDAGKLPPDAKANYQRWAALGDTKQLEEGSAEKAPDPRADLFVDALFGTGLTRPPPDLPLVRDFMAATFGSNGIGKGDSDVPHVVAIDCPSSLCMDSGRQLRPMGTVRNRDHFAHLTVSFHAEKLGHRLADGPCASGSVVVADIGLKNSTKGSPRSRVGVQPPPGGAVGGCPAAPGTVVRLADPDLYGLSKRTGGHKYSHGHALVLTGGAGRTGAARLAARGALRIGAGLVTLGVAPAAQQEVASQVAALMLSRVADGAALAGILQDARINALCLGPGLGVERARELVPVACGGVEPRPTVLDADALGAFGDDPETLFAVLHGACVLTPHAGEFGRLFPDIAKRLHEEPLSGPAYSKVDATREAAARAGCVVLFKGADTVIAAPDGRCCVNSAHYERAAPWLATAGSGDVLAGFLTGLLARAIAPMQAAETAAWLHVECALSFGPGLIAEDLPESLPGVFRRLGV